MIWTRNLQKDSAHFIFIFTFSKGAINAPCGDISRLTLSSTSRKSSLRRYLMPSRRQPICPVTWLVIWDCSSFVWETGRENVSLLTKVKRGIISSDYQHGSTHFQYAVTWCWSVQRLQLRENNETKTKQTNKKKKIIYILKQWSASFILYILF